MGYPIDKIEPNTQLFSIIGANAIENKKDDIFNSFFKQMDVDCKVMPLNIRQDDIGFFLNGLKDSKIRAVYFEDEYWESVANLLDSTDEEVNFCNLCDTIDIDNSNYNLRVSIGNAIVSILGDIKDKTILLIGSSNIAKSVLFNIIKKEPSKIILADEVIENLIDMMNIVPNKIITDVIRVQNDSIKEEFDLSINCTTLPIKCDIDTKKDQDKILNKIAEINTKIWSEKWTI